MPDERLQKLLASAGVASRRKAEELIQAGRVRVNGRVVTELGTRARPGLDRIEVDGRAVVVEKPLTILLNKPRGVVCTASDPEGRPTVLELVRGVHARLFPVGRLDFQTSGALILTNDGDLAQALTHPRFGVDKTYHVKIRGQVDELVLDQWRRGVKLEDGTTRPSEVHCVEVEAGYTWIEITVHEGRNRQIRRMAEATGLELVKLKRLAIAGLDISGVRIGEWREVTEKELARLYRDHVNPWLKAKAENRRQLRLRKSSSSDQRS